MLLLLTYIMCMYSENELVVTVFIRLVCRNRRHKGLLLGETEQELKYDANKTTFVHL